MYYRTTVFFRPILLVTLYFSCTLFHSCSDSSATVSSVEDTTPVERKIQEENKKVIKAWIEARNTNELETALSFWNEDWKERLTKGFNGTTEAFPDVKIIADDLLAENDKVVLQWTFKGTHQGNFQGIPATGKAITWNGVDIYTLTEGKISGIHRASDPNAIERQLKEE